MKLALDWDDEQVRLVAADRTARGIRIRAAAVAPIGEEGLQATLAELSRKYSLEKSDVLVAVGRDRAELRQMQFPPVPSDELPDMVRFQAIRQFASAGENAQIDYITTHTDEKGIHAIVAATGPTHLTPIRKTITAAGWTLERVGLRPIAAAALYRLKAADTLAIEAQQDDESAPIVALIDLVANEAEIVLLQHGDISFVRSVRLPDGDAATSKSRAASLAGEIRRSLIASGAAGSPCHVVMWGREERHGEELRLLSERLSGQQESPCQTRLLDPLELVGTDSKIREATGEMVGRLAPLVGLLVADADHKDELIDFLNPRRAAEKTSDKRKIAMLVGFPAVIALAVGWLLWSSISRLNTQIDRQTAINNELRKKTKVSDKLIEQTEQIDQFLDSDVNWLDELEQLAAAMPPSDELIVKDIVLTSNARGGGGKLVVSGLVTSPEVIKEFETAMRDNAHQVTGDKVTQLASNDAYRWNMTQTIQLAPEAVREKRYAQMTAFDERSSDPETLVEPVSSEPDSSVKQVPQTAPEPLPNTAPDSGDDGFVVKSEATETEPAPTPEPSSSSDEQTVSEANPSAAASDTSAAASDTPAAESETPAAESETSAAESETSSDSPFEMEAAK